MKKEEQHFRNLMEQLGEHRATPPAAMRDRFISEARGRRFRFFSVKNWLAAASLAALIVLSFLLVDRSRKDVLLFPAGVAVERFDESSQRIDPVYRRDDNFSRLKRSYR